MKKLLFAFAFALLCLPTGADATAYYINFQCADTATCGNGTATTTSFSGLDEFADVARTAGDIAFVRRGVASTTAITDVIFTSDGTLNNPITITADYDNLWGDFATSSVTFTPVFGSKFMATSASTTDAYPNKWIYVAGDCYETYNRTTLNPCEYAYEIEAASSTGIQLYLPYKGQQTGAGLSIRVMPSAPQWNITTGDFQWVMSVDDYWRFKGIHIRGTDASCGFASSNNKGTTLFDMVISGNGVTDCALGSSGVRNIFKLRVFGVQTFMNNATANYIKDALVDCNNVGLSAARTSTTEGNHLSFFDSYEVRNCISTLDNGGASVINIFRNFRGANTQATLSGNFTASFLFEDKFSVTGLNSTSYNFVTSNTVSSTTVSDTSNLRAGGGPTTMYVLPPSGTGNTGISTNYFPLSYIKLFEYPIYTDTSSKTYTMYFMATSSTAFTVAPLTATAAGSSTPEMYIECEYYNASSGADRFLKRSNTAAAFTADGTWYGISVTCQPTQTGILYLRGWYGKPNDGGSNWFFMDTTPVVS